MSNFSIRAFDEAQRRKMYPDRKGIVGIACMQRDIITAQKHLSILATILWRTSVDQSYRQETEQVPNLAIKPNAVQEQLGQIGVQLLQLSGALGIDFVSVLKHEIERLEITVI
jgi:hypothetical protein